MRLREISLRPGAGPVLVQITFGHANSGGYRLYRLDPGKRDPVEIGHGESGNHVPDRFFLGSTVEAWRDAHLTVLADLFSNTDSHADTKDQYSLTIKVMQNGRNVKGSPVFYSGEMTQGIKELVETLHFRVDNPVELSKGST